MTMDDIATKVGEIHRELCEEIAGHLAADELESFKNLCHSYIKRGKLHSMNTSLQVLDALQNKGVIGIGKYDKLREMFPKMEQNTLLEKLNEAEEKIKTLKRKGECLNL